jgi:hypothetical protein
VEVTDKNGNIIQGYEKGNCAVLKSDLVKQNIIWRNRSLLPDDMPYRLQFDLKNGSLFSYLVE